MARQELANKIETVKGLLAHSDPNITLGELFEKLCDLGVQEWAGSHTRRITSSARGLKLERNLSVCDKNSICELDSFVAPAVRHQPEVEIQKSGANPTAIKSPTAMTITKAKTKTKAKAKTNKASDQTMMMSVDTELNTPRNKSTTRNSQECRVGPIKQSRQTRPAVRASVRRIIFARAEHRCEKCSSTHALQIEHVIPYACDGNNKVENLRLLCRNCNQRSAIQAYGQVKMDQFLR